jgi:hypothetical protein
MKKRADGIKPPSKVLIDRDLHRRLKIQAAKRRTTMRALIEGFVQALDRMEK